MNDWDGVVAFALTLPDTYMDPFYGVPCPKVNKKAFVSPGGEADSFHVMCPHGEKAILLETDPDTFWQTAHYANYPMLLVRYGGSRDRVELYIQRAWWDRAKKPQRAQADMHDRP